MIHFNIIKIYKILDILPELKTLPYRNNHTQLNDDKDFNRFQFKNRSKSFTFKFQRVNNIYKTLKKKEKKYPKIIEKTKSRAKNERRSKVKALEFLFLVNFSNGEISFFCFSVYNLPDNTISSYLFSFFYFSFLIIFYIYIYISRPLSYYFCYA